MNKKEKITKFNIGIQRFKGRIQSTFMSFGLTRSAIVTIVTALIALSLPFLQYKSDQGEGTKGLSLDFIAGMGAAISAAYTIFTTIYEYRRRADGTVVFTDNAEKERVRNSLKVGVSEQQDGFEICRFNNGTADEYYMESKKFNSMLQSGDEISFTEIRRKYELPDKVKPLVPAILESAFRSPNLIFNGRLVRQTSCVDMNKKTVLLQKTDYFSGQCSHEIVHKQFVTPGDIGVGFDGKLLLNDKDGTVYTLSKSPCANFLGASTLAITRDKYIIVGKQANFSKANKGRFAPSGSGSVDYADIRKARRLYNRKKGELSLNELLTYTMDRELCEECNYPLKLAKTHIRTALTGYVRLMERGGKPDYFGVSFIDDDIENIQKNIRRSEYGLVDNIHPIPFEKHSDIPDILDRFIKEHTADKRISIQLYLIASQLREMKENGTLEQFFKGIEK